MSLSTGSALSPDSGGQTWENLTDGTGRCANTDPLLDRINLVYEGSGPMHIVPAAESTATPPPESRIDGCPSCVQNAETPSSAYRTGDGWLCNYICLDCGHAWSTAWKD